MYKSFTQVEIYAQCPYHSGKRLQTRAVNTGTCLQQAGGTPLLPQVAFPQFEKTALGLSVPRSLIPGQFLIRD